MYQDGGMATDTAERDRKLALAARMIGEALPGFYGTVRFGLQNGAAGVVTIEETVKLPSSK